VNVANHIDWIKSELNLKAGLAEDIFDKSSKLNIFQFADHYINTLKMEKLQVMNFHHAIIREKSIPKIQMSHIVIHSMTLLEMYMSYLIQSILMRSKTNINVVCHAEKEPTHCPAPIYWTRC